MRAGGLSLQYRELVAQQQDLDVLGPVGPAEDNEPAGE
jgi:hypothetical protein